jgi:alkenylglycerophosphocholine/alkenylglycerophosphoethanolamine hydrolase
MTYIPILIAMILAILDWFAAEKKLKPLEYITKPGTMLALLWWIWSSVGLGGDMLWFTLGVIFCLAGDVFLMVPRNLFIFGLIAFLLGHICYTIGFNNQSPYISLFGVFIIVLVGIYFGWLYPKLARGLDIKGESQLKIPVLIYFLVISMMVYSAMMTWNRLDWPTSAAFSVSLGAVLFFISDSFLGWDRFINPLSHARLRTMVTYHLGQFGIILGVILYLTIK